jgi:ATP-dependent Lon protease
MSDLNAKINQHFAGLAVRKDLTKTLKGNAIVPSYVLEYLLGQHCATDDPALIDEGVGRVREILTKHFVHRSEAELTKSHIKERGRHKVIDKITVELNDKAGVYEAKFTNLGLKKVPTATDYIKKHPKLLVGGVWCIIDMVYQASENPDDSPWHIDTLKPIQVSRFDFDEYLAARREFSTEEWLGVLMQTIGFNPEMMSRRLMLLQLIRLVSFCERNYNLMELGPKGTGKSHIFSEFSPHGILISGGEVSMAKLFVNNASGKIGLVGYWDCICFDEFAGKDKRVDKNLVDIMKNYMANKSFSRGIETMGAEASMVFMGNTKKSVPYMLKHSHFFEQLPDKYIDSAFLDRIHAFAPGWEVSPIRNDLFTDGYGLIVDYLAEILRSLRGKDFGHIFETKFQIDSDITTRDRDGLTKTFAGLMKLIYPHGECTREEMAELLSFAMECRKRVKDHILRIDETFEPKSFVFVGVDGEDRQTVLTPEERQYPTLANFPRDPAAESSEQEAPSAQDTLPSHESSAQPDELQSGEHVVVPENSKGYSYRRLFAAHLKGASKIVIRDPYVRQFWQVRNILELLNVIHDGIPDGEEVEVHLVTQSDPKQPEKQDENLNQVVETMEGSKLVFSFEYETDPGFHARSIVTDTGWKITLDRGLDFFQPYDMKALSFGALNQEERITRSCEITYLRVKDSAKQTQSKS